MSFPLLCLLFFPTLCDAQQPTPQDKSPRTDLHGDARTAHC